MFTEVPCDVQTCVEMYASGHTLTEIGDALGCSYMTVRRRLADAGVEIRKVGKQQQHCRHICLAMHEAGMTDAQIAETFGVTRTTVNEWIRSFGVKRGKGFASNKDMAGVLAKSNASRSRNATKRFVEKFESLHGDRFEIVECGTCNLKGGTCMLRCKTCGHEFDRYVSFKYKTTCPVCREAERMREAEERKAMKAEAEERRKAANLQVDRTCRECGATFHSEYEGAAYCSPECRRKHKRRAAPGRNAKRGGKYRHRKRARKYGCAYDPSVTLARLIERDGLTCYICGKQCDPSDMSWGSSGPNRPTLDHVVPLAKGGGHVWGNVKVCCGECNSAKRDLDVAEVLATA